VVTFERPVLFGKKLKLRRHFMIICVSCLCW